MSSMHLRVNRAVLGLALLAGLFTAESAIAQGRVFAYPLHGQSQEQQERDRFECHRWAARESGHDPIDSPANSSVAGAGDEARGGSRGFLGIGGDRNAVGGRGGVVSDAATGAALGAVGGAIAGDAGEGALIGAGAGAVFGEILRQGRPEPRRQDTQSSQHQRTRARDYRRALRACMKGRGYEVS